MELPANASTLLAEFDAAAWTQLGETTHAAFALLSRNGHEVARDRLFMPTLQGDGVAGGRGQGAA